MKRVLMALLFCSAAIFAQAEGQAAGGGISVFVPETLYLDGKGTIAFEQGFSTSFGIGDLLSVPVGFAYHAVDGFRLQHDEAQAIDGAAFYGDSLIPYLMLKAHVALGSMFYVEAFGGGALDWAFSLRTTGDFAKTMADDGEAVAVRRVTVEKGIGYGWVAGGALGVKFGKISVDLGGTYRSIVIPVTVTSQVTRTNAANVTTQETVKFADALAALRGVSVQLGGSYAF